MSNLEELEERVERLEAEDVWFTRNFRIGCFLLGLAFVTVAGHWGIAILGYFALKDIVFRSD